MNWFSNANKTEASEILILKCENHGSCYELVHEIFVLMIYTQKPPLNFQTNVFRTHKLNEFTMLKSVKLNFECINKYMHIFNLYNFKKSEQTKMTNFTMLNKHHNPKLKIINKKHINVFKP